MKKILLASAIALISSGAFAQSSQGQGAAAAGTNGNGANAPGAAMQNGNMGNGSMGAGTTGMNSGMQSTGPNGSAGDVPKAKGGPATGNASTTSSTPKEFSGRPGA